MNFHIKRLSDVIVMLTTKDASFHAFWFQTVISHLLMLNLTFDDVQPNMSQL